MNSTHLSTPGWRLLCELEQEVAEEFDTTLLANGLVRRVANDDQLRALCQAVAAADHARGVREREFTGIEDGSSIPSLCDHSHDLLERTLNERLAECIALECRSVLTVEGSSVAVDDEELAAATCDAATWLCSNEEVAIRLWGTERPPTGNHDLNMGP